MIYLYTIHGVNCQPLWGITRRKQGRQTRYCLDFGHRWIAWYFR